jgi:hypothetical protein
MATKPVKMNYVLRLKYCPTIIGHKKADTFLKNVVRLVSERSTEFPRLVAEAEPVKAPLYTVILESAFLATFLLSLLVSIIWPPKGPLRGWTPPFELPDVIDRFVGRYGFPIAITSLILVFLVAPVLNRSGAFEVNLYETSESEAQRAKDGYQGGGRRRVIYDESIRKGKLVGSIWSRKGLLDIGNTSQKGKVPAAWRVVEAIADLLVIEQHWNKNGKGADVIEKRSENQVGNKEETEINGDIDKDASQIGRRLAIEELEELEKRLQLEEEEGMEKKKKDEEKEKKGEEVINGMIKDEGFVLKKRGRQGVVGKRREG